MSIPRHTTTIIILGFGLFAAQFAWVIYNTYVPIFLQAGSPQFTTATALHGFGLTATQTGVIMTVDNIAALFLQPFSGAFSDRVRTSFGRRRPFLMIGMPIAAFGMAAIPLALAGPLSIFILCLLVMVIAMACWRAPLFALMADLTPSASRSQANGILNLMAGLGGVFAFVIGSLLYTIYRPLPFWATALIFFSACGLINWRVQEPINSTLNEAHPNPNFLQYIHTWFSTISPVHRRSLLFLTSAVFCYMLGFQPIEAFFSSYGVTTLKLSEANSGLVLSAAYIAFILCAIPAAILANRIGRKRTVVLGLVLFAVALLLAFFTPITTVIVLLMMLGGLAWALIDINAFPMMLDISPGADGTTAGIYFIATTLAATIGPILNGWLIDLSGRNYSLIFMIGPVFFLLSFLFMMGVKHGEAYR